MASSGSRERCATGEEEKKKEVQRQKDAGDKAYNEKDYQGAVEHYTSVAKLDPSDISILTKRAKANFRMNKYKECRADCDKAVDRCKEVTTNNKELAADALSWKASALLHLAACAADHEPVIRALDESLALCPSNSKDRQNKREKAKSSMKKFKENEDDAKLHQDKGGQLISQKKYKEAAMQFTEAIQKNSRDPKNFSDRALCNIELRAWHDALEDACKCISLDPTFGMGYVRKGRAQFLMGEREDAVATYLDGLKLVPKNLQIHDGLKRCVKDIEMDSDAQAKVLTEHKREIEHLRKELENSKHKASEERSRRVKSEKMVKTIKDLYLRQIEHLTKQHGEAIMDLQSIKEHNASLQRQLAE